MLLAKSFPKTRSIYNIRFFSNKYGRTHADPNHSKILSRNIQPDEKKKLDPYIQKLFNEFDRASTDPEKTLKSFNMLIEKQGPELHMWHVFERTKPKLIEALKNPTFSKELGVEFLLTALGHLMNLKKRSPLWKFEIQHTDLYDLMEDYIISQKDNLNSEEIKEILYYSSNINFQTKKLINAFVPKVLKSSSVNLRSLNMIVRALNQTTLMKDYKSQLVNLFESNRIIFDISKSSSLYNARELLQIISGGIYPTNYITAILKKVTRYQNQQQLNRFLGISLDFLFHCDKDKHKINLTPFEPLFKWHTNYKQELLSKSFSKTYRSKIEILIGNELMDDIKLNSNRCKTNNSQKLQNPEASNNSPIIIAKSVDYYSVDFLIHIPNRKPIAAEVSAYKTFRNDVYDQNSLPKVRWLAYKGMDYFPFNDKIFREIVRSAKDKKIFIYEEMANYYDQHKNELKYT